MLGQTAFTMSVSEAILDSGTTAIYLPQADAQAINQVGPITHFLGEAELSNLYESGCQAVYYHASLIVSPELSCIRCEVCLSIWFEAKLAWASWQTA